MASAKSRYLIVNCAVLSEDDCALIGDALGYLWANAPARRDEIRDLCLRTDLKVATDG